LAYPFTKLPSLDGFIRKAQEEFGAEMKTVESRGPRGPVTHVYLVRDGKLAVVPEMVDDGCLPPSVVRSLCERLGLPLDAFGFNLN
jgi:hypothetical protein